MIKQSLLISNPDPLNFWIDSVKLNNNERIFINNAISYINKFNGVLNDFTDSNRDNQGSTFEYKTLVSYLLSMMPNCKLLADSTECLLKKRATIHIEELFAKYVNDNTFCIVSHREHISAERCIKKVKNVLYLDHEDNFSEIKYLSFDKIFNKIQNYKNIFVYVLGTEFTTGRVHNNVYYKQLYEFLKSKNKNVIMVLDAVQEMFLFPRDYSFYNYIIGTVHSLCTNFDQGILLINKNLTDEKELSYFSGYKHCIILQMIIQIIEIVLQRHAKLLTFKNIMIDSINYNILSQFNMHDSCTNFISLFQTGKYLYDTDCINFIQRKFIEPAKKEDPYINVEINYWKKYLELFVRIRAQSYMFNEFKIIEKIDYFNSTYFYLQKLQQSCL